MISKFGRSGIVITVFFRYNIFLCFFPRRESNHERAKSEEKEAMAKQIKVSLKFEIEEVCLSIFHWINLLILPIALNFF